MKRHKTRRLKTLKFSIFLQVDNEENALVILRIIIELHKQFRPAFSAEV